MLSVIVSNVLYFSFVLVCYILNINILCITCSVKLWENNKDFNEQISFAVVGL